MSQRYPRWFREIYKKSVLKHAHQMRDNAHETEAILQRSIKHSFRRLRIRFARPATKIKGKDQTRSSSYAYCTISIPAGIISTRIITLFGNILIIDATSRIRINTTYISLFFSLSYRRNRPLWKALTQKIRHVGESSAIPVDRSRTSRTRSLSSSPDAARNFDGTIPLVHPYKLILYII